VRGRGGLNKIVVLALALLLAMGALGTAYGAWVDEIYIEGFLSTSDINTSLACGDCWEEVNNIITNDTNPAISCTGSASPLSIEVTNAQYNATATLNTHYYCEFTISNAVNSFPVTVASRSITGYTGVHEEIESLPIGTVIDPGGSATGRVHIYLTDATQATKTLTFTLTVAVN